MTSIVRVFSISVVLCFFFFVSLASAQVKSGTITGTVTDSTGANVAGASITITDTDTRVSTRTKSNKDGNFTVPYLAQGKYAVQVEAAGFKTYKVDGLVLGTEATLRVNAALVVGAVTQVVEVNTSVAQLQTESGSVEGAVGADIIYNIPNLTNNPLYYATLQAGVSPSPQQAIGSNLGVGYNDRIAYSGININGGSGGTNDVQIDGLSVQGTGWHEALVLPNRDAVQEVRVDANDLSADIGGGQGVISLATKSGTNQFHGDLSYRMRNEAFNANGAINNLQGLPRGKYRLNEGGGAIGGPVVIPHVFNGKDKVFFFVSFSRLSHSDVVSGFANVPTTQERTGDFGSSLEKDANGNPVPVQIYNPFLAAPFIAGQVWKRPEYGPGTCSAAFAAQYGHCGDAVSNPDAAGLLFMSGFPLPNHTPIDVYNDSNYIYSGLSPEARNNLSARMDFHFGKHSLYTSGGVDTGYHNGYNTWGSKSVWYNGAPNFSDFNPYASVGDTVTLSPTMLLDVRVGVTRLNAVAADPYVKSFTSSDYTKYGMPAAVQQLISGPASGSAPVVGNPICCKGTNNSLLNQNGFNNKHEHQTNYMATGSVTKVLGKWTLRNGAEYRLYFGDWTDFLYSTPALLPWGQFTAGSSDFYNAQYSDIGGGPDSTYNTTPQQNGYAAAQWATGVSGWLLPPGSQTPPALATKYYAFYSQNDWKATRKLTLNLGLRYEVQPASTERFNRMSDLDLTAADPFASGANLPNPLGGMGRIAFVGRNGYGRGLWNTQWNNFSPRLGVAYQLTDSTVVRGGFGRLFTPSATGYNANGTIYGTVPFENGANALPFGFNQNGLPTGTFDSAPSPNGPTQLVMAPGPVQSPLLYGNLNNANGVDYFQNKNFKNGYLDQWNATLEKRLGGWVTSAAYVGSRGADLGWRAYQINGSYNIPWTTLQGWEQQWEASNGTNNPGNVQVPNPLPQLIGQATGTSGQATVPYAATLLPYFGFLGQTIYASKGTSRYNSLQLRAQHSLSHGLSALFTYTLSRATGIDGGQNGSNFQESNIAGGSFGNPSGGVDYRNLNNNNSLLNFDTTHRLVAALHYELPIGKGRQFDPHNGIVSAIIGGWEVDPVITLQSGTPWGPSCGSENGRCIPTGQPVELPKSYQRWYDGNTQVTLPDGHTFTPSSNTYLKWNPDAFGAPITHWADGSAHIPLYWLGTTPMFIDGLRNPWYKNVNLDVSKSFQFTERTSVQILAEATNLFNHQSFLPGLVNNNYGGTNTILANGSLGQNLNTAAGSFSLGNPTLYDPRQMTLSLRINF